MAGVVKLGPDAARYWHAAVGGQVPRPFHLRWLLPQLCGHDLRRWWAVWVSGWVLAAAGVIGWQRAAGADWWPSVAAAVLLVALPGFLGPSVTIPVGVDIPATGVAVCGVALCAQGWWVSGVAVIAVAACIRETSPAWAALWLWSPWPLLVLAVPVVVHLLRRPGPDPLGPKFQAIADHPVRSSLQYHAGRWRDGWLMVAPWGICLAALYSPDWRLLVVLVVAYAQLLLATDTVRLYSHAAGPALAVAAVAVIPVAWLPLALAAHVVWWRTPERV